MEFPPQLQKTQARTKSKGLQLSLLLTFCLVLFNSCNEGEGTLKGRFMGSPGEVIIVMEDSYWKGAPGDVMRDQVLRVQNMLPQGESVLTPIVLPKIAFGQLMRTHRSIIIADIEDNARNVDTRSEMIESRWSEKQVVYTIHARTPEEFIEEFKKKGKTIVDDIILRDRNRVMDYQKIVSDPAMTSELNEKMGVDLTIPKDFAKVKIGKHFASYTRNRIHYLSGVGHDVIQGILVYEYPYQGDSIFTEEYQIHLRDSITAKYVLSSTGAPMFLEPRLPAEGEERTHMNNFAYEMRGLWKFDQPLMGGPYLSLSMVDQSKGRVITVDGYVFAPKFDKREFLREMEAIVYSLNY